MTKALLFVHWEAMYPIPRHLKQLIEVVKEVEVDLFELKVIFTFWEVDHHYVFS